MERKNIPFCSKLKFIKKINDDFSLCDVTICALKKNRNKSFIGKDAADDAEPSIYNIPVIGHIYEGKDGSLHMGGHDMTVVPDGDGNYRLKSLCVPYGVVPSDNDIRYEDIVDSSGEIKTYIYGKCILWTGRYPELLEAMNSEDGIAFNQSMEINVLDSEPLAEDNNYMNIRKYTYSALCLLGRSDDSEYNVEPCFPDAHVILEEFAATSKFSELMEQMKVSLSACFSAEKSDGKEEEVKMTEDMRNTILAEFGVTLDELDFEITDNMTEEDFRAKVDEYACKKKKKYAEENGDKTADDENDKKVKCENEFSFTYREKAEAIAKAMPNSGNVNYYVCDFDDKYVYVERCVYSGNGCTDEHGRYEYTFNTETKEAEINGDFEAVFVRWLTKEEDLQLDAIRAQYAELVSYKENRETQDKNAALDAAIGEFSDLNGNADFDLIRENRYGYASVDALKNDCYIIRGKYSVMASAHKPATEPSVPVGAAKEPEEGKTIREKLHEVYGRTE